MSTDTGVPNTGDQRKPFATNTVVKKKQFCEIRESQNTEKQKKKPKRNTKRNNKPEYLGRCRMGIKMFSRSLGITLEKQEPKKFLTSKAACIATISLNKATLQQIKNKTKRKGKTSR